MKEMEIVARHMVGDYKYIILHNLKGEEFPVMVRLTEAKITVKPAYDEEEGHCLSVSTEYKAYDRCRGIYHADEKDIYDTKKEAYKVIEFRKTHRPGIAQYIADNWWEMLGEDEKPVLNDLEEAADEYTQRMLESWRFDSTGCRPPRESFIAGAQWQAERFEKNRLSNCDTLTKEDYDRETAFAMEVIENEHRQPTFTDAINYGMRLQAEQDQPITGNSLEQEWLRYVDKKMKENRGELPALGDYGWLMIARHFAKWQKKQDTADMLKSDFTVFNKCYEQGKKDIAKALLAKYKEEADKCPDADYDHDYTVAETQQYGRFMMMEDIYEEFCEPVGVTLDDLEDEK